MTHNIECFTNRGENCNDKDKNAFTNIHKLFCLETAEAFLRNLLFSPCIHHGENFYSDVSFKLKGI